MSRYNFEKCDSEEYIVKKGVLKYTGKKPAIIVPDEVTEIKDSSIKKVKAIYVGKNVSIISTNKVEWFEVDEENPYFSSIEGILYNKEKNSLLKYPVFRKEDSYNIPSTVTSIGEEAFSHAKLTNVVLHDNISEIKKGAFKTTKNLTKIVWPKDIYKIDDSVFAWSNIKSIVYSGVIKEIGASAFWSSEIEEYDVPESVERIGDSAFGYCRNLKRLTFSSNLIKIPKDCCYYCEQLTDITIPDTVKEIEESAFNGCKSLKNVKFPSGLVSIGKSAFIFCENLKSVILPHGLISIGEKAFSYTGVEKIIVPDSVENSGTIFTDVKIVIKQNLTQKEEIQKQKVDKERAESEEREARIQKKFDEISEMLQDLEKSLNKYKEDAKRLTKKRMQMNQKIQNAKSSGNMTLYKSLLLQANEIPESPIVVFNGPKHTVKLYNKNNIDGTYAIEQDGTLYLQNLCEFQDFIDAEIESKADATELDRGIMTGIVGGAFLGYLATSVAKTYFYATVKFTLLSKDGSRCRVVMLDNDKLPSEIASKKLLEASNISKNIARMLDNAQNDLQGYNYIQDNKTEIMQSILGE